MHTDQKTDGEKTTESRIIDRNPADTLQKKKGISLFLLDLLIEFKSVFFPI